VSRLYHHLAILARSYILQQLFFYIRSMTCVMSYESVKVSIMTLFTLILNDKKSAYHRFLSFETVFIKTHEILFCERSSKEFNASLHQIKNLLNYYIERVTVRFKEQGVFVIIACIAALFEYESLREATSSKSIFRLAFEEFRTFQIQQSKSASSKLHNEVFDLNDSISHSFFVFVLDILTSFKIQFSQVLISQASNLAFSSLSIALSRVDDKNIFFLIHVYFVFL
jgi:hypothetical protein